MIYLFYGDNAERARGKWRQVAESFVTKYPDGAIFRFDAEHFDSGQFEELYQSFDLFGGKRLVVADRLLENPEALAFVEERAKEIVAAPTVFAFLEVKSPAALIKKLEKTGGRVEEFKLNVRSSAPNKSKYNMFALCDALGARDRKGLWSLFQDALFVGVSAEEVFWILVWQVKNMLLVTKSKGQSLKTVKSFVADKASRFARNYSEAELEKLSSDLVSLWHDSKQENPIDFEVGLEKLILGL